MTSSRTRRRMRCSTACIRATRSGPISTWRRSTKLSPTLSRCSSTSPCLSRSRGRSGRAQGSTADIGRRLGQLAQQFGQAMGMHGALRRFVGEVGSRRSEAGRHSDRAAHARRDSGLGRLRRVPHHLSVAVRRPDPARDQWVGHPAGRRNLGRSREPARERSVEDGGACAQHVHPRARLLPARQSRIRRLSARDHHRGSRSRARRQPRLSCRLHRRVPRTRNRALRHPAACGGQPAVGAAADGPEACERVFRGPSRARPELGPGDRSGDSVPALAQECGHAARTGLSTRTSPQRLLLRQILGFEEPAKPWTGTIGDQAYSGEIRPIEVHSVRVCRRHGPTDRPNPRSSSNSPRAFRADPDQTDYRGGCTLLFDLDKARLDYVVRKRLLSPWSFKNQGERATGGDESRGGRGTGLLPA